MHISCPLCKLEWWLLGPNLSWHCTFALKTSPGSRIFSFESARFFFGLEFKVVFKQEDEGDLHKVQRALSHCLDLDLNHQKMRCYFWQRFHILKINEKNQRVVFEGSSNRAWPIQLISRFLKNVLKWCPIIANSPLCKFQKCNNFPWGYWFSSKYLFNFVSLSWKQDNPYYHHTCGFITQAIIDVLFQLWQIDVNILKRVVEAHKTKIKQNGKTIKSVKTPMNFNFSCFFFSIISQNLVDMLW